MNDDITIADDYDLNKFKYFDIKMALENNAPYKINLWTYFVGGLKKFFNFRKTEEQRLYEKTENIFAEEMDICNFMKKLHEIEKLKMILLNKKQRALLQIIAKPLIYVEEDNNNKECVYLDIQNSVKQSLTMTLKKRFHRRKSLKEYLKWVEKDSQKNPISKRLLGLVKKEMDILS